MSNGSPSFYEHDILRHLRDARWPVAAPIGAVVERSDITFALFPLLPGEPCGRESELQSRRRGRILAKLHLELDPCSGRGQRTDGNVSMKWCRLVKVLAGKTVH